MFIHGSQGGSDILGDGRDERNNVGMCTQTNKIKLDRNPC